MRGWSVRVLDSVVGTYRYSRLTTLTRSSGYPKGVAGGVDSGRWWSWEVGDSTLLFVYVPEGSSLCEWRELQEVNLGVRWWGMVN